MTFNLDTIKVSISDEDNGVRLTTEDENWLIGRQTLDETKTIIGKNFKIIKEYFSEKAEEPDCRQGGKSQQKNLTSTSVIPGLCTG